MRSFLKFLLVFLLVFTTLQASESDEFEAEFSPQSKQELFDPLSGYNEIMTSFNDAFYEYALRPVAKGYAYVVPQMARNGISNAFENLLFPVRFINNILQLKFQNAFEETGRFVINSTMGILGFRDVAGEELGLQKHDEDFGQTLGHYGKGNGFHIVLPFLGPSNARDIVGLFADSWASPLSYISARDDLNLLDNDEQALGLMAFRALNETSLHIDELDSIRKDAIELYPFLRNIYESRRNKQISE